MRIAVAALLAFAATCADAQTAPPSAVPVALAPRQPPATIVAEPAALLIAACDANSDARVTRPELTVCVAHGFAGDAAQGNTLGYIGYADWALKWLGDRNALPSPFTVDTDNDNRISLAELQTQFQTLFTRFDVDKDGVLTRAELLTIRSGTGGGDADGNGRHRGGKR